MFDIDAMTNAPVDSNATTIPVCPEGEYTAIVDSFGDDGLKGWTRILQGKDNKPDRLIVEVPFVILDDKVKEELGREKVIVRYTCWLDMGPDGVTLLTGEGKNIDLGRLREALGQNTSGWSWARLPGAGPIKVMVKHRDGDRGKFAYVNRVAAL